MGLGIVISLALLMSKICADLPISYFWVIMPTLIMGVFTIIFKHYGIESADIEF